MGFRTGKKKLDIQNTSEKVTFDKEEWSTNVFLILIDLHLLVVGMFWHCSTREGKEKYLTLETGVNTNFRKQFVQKRESYTYTHSISVAEQVQYG